MLTVVYSFEILGSLTEIGLKKRNAVDSYGFFFCDELPSYGSYFCFADLCKIFFIRLGILMQMKPYMFCDMKNVHCFIVRVHIIFFSRHFRSDALHIAVLAVSFSVTKCANMLVYVQKC